MEEQTMHFASRWVLVLAILLVPRSVVKAEGITDLSLTNTASPSPVQAMTTLTYSLNILNNGPTVVATGVRVTDALPPGVTLVSATATQGTCSGTAPVIYTIGTLTVGGGAAVTIVVRPQASSAIPPR
jgi:uncharacterized repeat protein (TIGR01451 family)